jgi:uncharacterized phiE125 gp8 family phage protein
MALRLVTDCTVEPVTAQEVHDFLRLPTTADYAVINVLIKTARQYAENYCKRAFNPQVWQLTLDGFPSGGIEIPRPPMSTAAAGITITYYDSSAALQTLGSSAYVVDYESEPGIVVPSTIADEWPETNEQLNAVKIQFTAGYPYDVAGGGSTCTVPEGIKTWIKMRVGAMYENREAIQGTNRYEMPRSFIDGLLDPYIIIAVP